MQLLDFRKISLPQKNHTFRVSDCDEVRLNFDGKKKPFFDGIEIKRITKLTIKPHTLENVDRLTVQNVGELLVEQESFVSLISRYVEFENVSFSKGTVFRPKYVLDGLKILNSTFESNAVIQLDNSPGMDRRIVLSKNQFKNPTTLSLYSHHIELSDNSFDSELPSIRIRYAQQLISKGNTKGLEKTPLPDITGAGKVMDIVFDEDKIDGSLKMGKSQQNWLQSFAFETPNKAIQPRMFEETPSDEQGCLTQKLEDTTHNKITVHCSDVETYNQFVGAGQILMPPTIVDGSSGRQRGARTNPDDQQEEDRSKHQESDKKHVLAHQDSQTNNAPSLTISLSFVLALALPNAISNAMLHFT